MGRGEREHKARSQLGIRTFSPTIGFWAKELSAKFGVSVPLVPIHHQYLVTKTVPEVRDGLTQELPVIRHLEVCVCGQRGWHLLIVLYCAAAPVSGLLLPEAGA